jgi:probable HAF family extracellular repeat protein
MHVPSAPRAAAAGLALVLAFAPAWANRYAVVDLGAGQQATDINSTGSVTGSALDLHATVYRGHRWHSLPDGSNDSFAASLNDAGQVVGTVHKAGAGDRAVLWQADRKRVVLKLPAGGTDGYPQAISGAGAVVGWYATAANPNGLCFEWTPAGGSLDLGLPAGASACRAYAVNGLGDVVGGASVGKKGWERAFLWAQGAFVDLGTLGGNSAAAVAVNAQGVVVGSATVDGGGKLWHAFLWADGAMTDIGTSADFESSYATSINGVGDVVGYALSKIDFLFRAARFADGAVIDLTTETDDLDDWHLDFAYAVNDHGDIVGNGRRADGYHAFLLVKQGDAAD